MIKNQKGLSAVAIAGLSLIGLFAIFFVLANRQSPENSNDQPKFHSAHPNDKEFFETAYRFADKEVDLSDQHIVAGVIPHHLLAADLIADFFQNLEGADYQAVILIGPNHFLLGQSDIITSVYDWHTPYGILEHDSGVLQDLLEIPGLGINTEEDVIQGEHSINSEVSFIKKTFPQARFMPIILKPGVNQETATKLAEALFGISQNRKILVLASVDFSHYKNSRQAQQDDKVSIAAISDFNFSNVYNIEVDSSPSIYALLKFSELNRASFNMLDNSNSAILAGKPDLASTTSYVTGYFTQQKISALFVGDIMLDRGVKTLIDQKGLNYLFDELAGDGFFSGYDLIGANLEGVVTNNGQYYQPVKEFDFVFHPETVSRLADYGFNFFNLANNHFDDQGERGIAETRKNLSNLGFYFSGCQDGLIAECSSTIISIKDEKLGMVGLSTVGTKFDLEKAGEAINLLKGKTDWIIVNIHWGEEYDTHFDKIQQEIAHKLIDYGADAVIGHHPHVVQEVEVYNSRPIFYSLGNFIFDQYFLNEAQEGLAVSLNFLGDIIDYSLHPLGSSAGKLF